MEYDISKELLKRHILPHKKAYTYLKETLILMRSKDGNVLNFVKELYAPVALKHGVCIAAVVKAMSACIPCAIKSEEEYFSDCVSLDGRSNLKGFLLKIYSLVFCSI